MCLLNILLDGLSYALKTNSGYSPLHSINWLVSINRYILLLLRDCELIFQVKFRAILVFKRLREHVFLLAVSVVLEKKPRQCTLLQK
jgi:hypothetical protein